MKWGVIGAFAGLVVVELLGLIMWALAAGTAAVVTAVMFHGRELSNVGNGWAFTYLAIWGIIFLVPEVVFATKHAIFWRGVMKLDRDLEDSPLFKATEQLREENRSE